MQDISVTLHLGVEPDSGAVTGLVLASGIDADRRLRCTRTIRIPAGLAPGSYRLLASSGNRTTWDPLILLVR